MGHARRDLKFTNRTFAGTNSIKVRIAGPIYKVVGLWANKRRITSESTDRSKRCDERTSIVRIFRSLLHNHNVCWIWDRLQGS